MRSDAIGVGRVLLNPPLHAKWRVKENPPYYAAVGSTETLTYDASSNVLTRKTRANQTISFAYDTLNRLKTKTPPSAPVVSYGYDLNSRLTSVSDTSAAIVAAVPPTLPSVRYATTTAYDILNRPTGVSWDPAPAATPPPTASSVTFGHNYNKANQRSGQTVTDSTWLNYPATTPSTASYAADALNRYTAVGAVSPTYDANGNLTSDGTYTFGYDSENRLTSASGAGNTASYTFDAQGRRKTKTVNGTTTVFVTDAGNREVLEYDGASGAILRWYAYGLGSNDVLNQINVAAGTRVTLVPGILGSVIGSQDSGSGTLSKIGYLPYGKSATAGPFGYTGQRIDSETGGLYYYRARHYSPLLGRFIQTDPIGYNGGINLYAYVGNDPLNFTDPNGLVKDGVVAILNTPLTGPQTIPNTPNLQSCGICVAQPLLASPSDYADVGTTVRPLTVGDAVQAGLEIGSIVGAGAAGRFTRSAVETAQEFKGIASALEKIGGGVPQLVPTPKGATQFIFPNGTVLRFDIQSAISRKPRTSYQSSERTGKLEPKHSYSSFTIIRPSRL